MTYLPISDSLPSVRFHPTFHTEHMTFGIFDEIVELLLSWEKAYDLI